MDDHDREVDDEVDALIRRRVPCMIAYLHPFRVVQADGQPTWNATIDQINHRDWDYAALHEVVGGIDVGLQSPYHLAVGRDGALALRRSTAFGRHRPRSSSSTDVSRGCCWAGYIAKPSTQTALISGRSSTGHTSGRTGTGRSSKPVPRTRSLSPGEPDGGNRSGASTSGWARRTPGCYEGRFASSRHGPACAWRILLRGTTGLARLDWGSSLANLWIVVEQLVAERGAQGRCADAGSRSV